MWQTQRSMTGGEFQAAFRELGMLQAQAARFLGVSERQARRYVLGVTPVPPAMALLLRSMMHHRDIPIVPAWQPERLRRQPGYPPIDEPAVDKPAE